MEQYDEENDKKRREGLMEEEDDSSDEFDRILGDLTDNLEKELEVKKKKEKKNIDVNILIDDLASVEDCSNKVPPVQRFYPKGQKTIIQAVMKGDEEIVRKLIVEHKISANVLERNNFETVYQLFFIFIFIY